MKLPESMATVPLGREHVVQRDSQGARIDSLSVALIVERHVPPPDLGGEPVSQRRRPVSGSARPSGPPAVRRRQLRLAAALCSSSAATALAVQRRRRRPRRGARAGACRWPRRRCRPGSPWRPGRSALPCRVVHMFSEQPQATIRSAPPISSAASGEAKPPLTSRSHGLPRNRPLAAADVASSAPQSSASAPAPAAAPAPARPGPAMNTGRAGDRQRGRQRRRVAARRAACGGALARRRCTRPGALAGLHVERQRQHYRPPLVARAVRYARTASSTANAAECSRAGSRAGPRP